ncbi:MAG: hypothetical protein AAF663_00005, partial [Planctomycetota bacterium]
MTHSHAGTRFSRLIHQKYKVQPCPRCRELIEYMDSMDLEQLVAHKQHVLNLMWNRRLHPNFGLYRVALIVPWVSRAVFMAELGKLYDQALLHP